MSTSVELTFLSRSFMSLQSLANLAPSISGGDPFAPKTQKSLKTSSNVRAMFTSEVETTPIGQGAGDRENPACTCSLGTRPG